MAKAKRRVSRRTITTTSMYQRVFDTLEGRKVLNDLMRTHHMMASTYKGEPYEAAFAEGERSVVLRILGLLKVDVAELDKRITEAEKEIQNEERSYDIDEH